MHIPRACARGGSTALGLAAFAVLVTLIAAGGAWANTGSVPLNFNATSIPADGRFIWFNSVINPTLPSGADPVTIFVRNVTFHIVKGATILDVPGVDSNIVYSSSSVAGPTTFSGGHFVVPTPIPTLAGNEFADGLAYQPGVDLGNANVTWTADFFTDYAGTISLKWQAAAAVYTTFTTDYNALMVKPVDANNWWPSGSSDKAGTPEGSTATTPPQTFKSFVVGGATGGGGSNFTGSLSPTVTVIASHFTPPVVPEPGTLPILASGLSLCALFLRRRMRRS